MTSEKTTIQILLVEDDEENLNLLVKSLPSEIANHTIDWQMCNDFTKAKKLTDNRRFDIIVTDIYRDRRDHRKGGVVGDEKANTLIQSIRSKRFCPVVAFTDGSAPQSFQEGPFIKLADKSKGNREILTKLEELIRTGIPGIAHKLHEELDRSSGSYLWEFLEENWEKLYEKGLTNPIVLERLVRRRAAIQIGRLNPTAQNPSEMESIEGLEYYIRPPISSFHRLGEIIRHKSDSSFRVVLTPHCHLTIQPGQESPRAEYVLTTKTVKAVELFRKYPPEGGSEKKKLENLFPCIRIPANIGQPRGRYCFLPGFLEMPDLFCDFLQVESIALNLLEADFITIAVLDTPYAEALQSSFNNFYSNVGTPNLQTNNFKHLISQ